VGEWVGGAGNECGGLGWVGLFLCWVVPDAVSGCRFPALATPWLKCVLCCLPPAAGHDNLFLFGVEADTIGRLREVGLGAGLRCGLLRLLAPRGMPSSRPAAMAGAPPARIPLPLQQCITRSHPTLPPPCLSSPSPPAGAQALHGVRPPLDRCPGHDQGGRFRAGRLL
jgi:hypothetical protein